ncbi:MAG TPA: DUF1707 domain-containing protein [Solirubrobacteraceae bacterium]|nr:DUF1707 domain-containing protein [Solirubrobacteraceae bacterium]
MAEHAALRASDSDRWEVAGRLRRATADGRLGPEELEERLGALFASRTYGELDVLVADLPPERQGPAEPLETPVAVWVACVVSGSLMFAVVGVLMSGVGARAQTLFALVLAATLVGAAGWMYSRAADRGAS